VASNIGPDAKFLNVPSITSDQDALPQVPSKSVVESAFDPSSSQYARYVLFPAVMRGNEVANASATQDQLGNWVVDCNLTSTGSKQWDAATKQYFHEYMAIELDGQVISAPIIQPTQSVWTSFNGSVEVSGSLSQSQANLLAADLTYGSLPVPLQVLTSESVSPTLGHAALVAGLGAGLAGLALVLLYVLFYYRLLGAVVLTGLAVTAAILWALISALGRTSVAPSFDLAGVTGLIVSIGITTDSYIVYFERLKDEARSGRTVRTSLDRGFASAWRTVLAADTVSLLAAVLLFFLAVGSVRGFAFFLGLSTLLDVIVTWFFTRPAVYLLARNERLTSMRRIGVASGLGARGVPA
jgi:preprotein translocase subunit SecD